MIFDFKKKLHWFIPIWNNSYDILKFLRIIKISIMIWDIKLYDIYMTVKQY